MAQLHPLGSAWRSLAAVGATRRQRDASRHRSWPCRNPRRLLGLVRDRAGAGGGTRQGASEGRPEERLGFFARPKLLIIRQARLPEQRRASVLPTGVATLRARLGVDHQQPVLRRAGQTAITRRRPAVAQAARERLVGGLQSRCQDSEPGQQSDHRMDAAIESLFLPLQARGLDLTDLVGEQAQPCPLAPQLGRCVRRHRLPFRRGQPLEPLHGRAQGRPKPRMPRRASALLIRLPMRVRSPTRFSRSQLGRFASSSSRLGTAAMLQWSRSPRSLPRKLCFSSRVSSRSVFAPRCSARDGDAIRADPASPGKTPASMPCARNAMS
jgi:hypothetical protein